jgi:hypothetical protein
VTPWLNSFDRGIHSYKRDLSTNMLQLEICTLPMLLTLLPSPHVYEIPLDQFMLT